MLSKKEILEMAWLHQLEIWDREKEYRDQCPNEFTNERERRSWDKLEELHRLYLEEV